MHGSIRGCAMSEAFTLDKAAPLEPFAGQARHDGWPASLFMTGSPSFPWSP